MGVGDTKPPRAAAAGPRPLRKDAERNRQRILDAAREVFAQRGLEASLDDIADHAGVGIGTVYRRFRDKDELIDALLEEHVELVLRVGRAALAGDDPWQNLISFLTEMTSAQADNRGLKQMMLLRNDDGLVRARAAIISIVSELVGRAQESGRMRPDLELDDLHMIGVMVSGLADHLREVDPDAWRRYLQIVIDGLVTSRLEPTPLPGKPVTHTDFLRAQTARGR